MQRYFVRCAYQGSNYSGWQIQNNAPSVQATIQDKFSIVLGTPIEIVGCGRTDTGVHASSYIFHFDSPKPIDKALCYSLKSIVPDDIVINAFTPVSKDAHARYSAVSRSYVYQLRISSSPFRRDEFFDYKGKALNQTLMATAAERLLKLDDFEMFSKTGSQVNHFLCTIMESRWDFSDSNCWYYHIKANRFLRGMVRLIVGMLINVGSGKISLENLETCIEQSVPVSPNYSVPAHGLFLNAVIYPEEILPSINSNRSIH